MAGGPAGGRFAVAGTFQVVSIERGKSVARRLLSIATNSPSLQIGDGGVVGEVVLLQTFLKRSKMPLRIFRSETIVIASAGEDRSASHPFLQ
jgi:hypothetical protein